MKKKDELILLLNSKEESERLYAVEDILDFGLVELSLELLTRLSIETSPAVKNSIVSVLQKMEHTPSYPMIFKLFPNRDAYMRNSAVSIFSSYGENAITFLSSYLDHADKEVRKLILDSLIEIATRRSEIKNSVQEIFRACLYDPSINVVITAIEYLGRVGDKNSLEDLIQLYKRVEEPMLRSSILDCVLKIGNKEDFENTISTLFQDLPSVDSLYIPQVMRLLAQSEKKEEFLQLVRDKQQEGNFSEDILACIDWLIKKEILAPNECTTMLKGIANTEKLGEDMRVICVTLLLASGDTGAVEFVLEWSKKGSKEFQAFCMESMEKEKMDERRPSLLRNEEYLSPEEFEILANFIYHKSGIKMEANKTYLLNNRVQKRIRELRFSGAAEYIRYLKYSDKNGSELQEFLNLVTVNETFFFRDFPQLEAFVECVKAVVEQKMLRNDYTLRIWSAGCSTGEEPYTLSIILHEILDDIQKWKITIMASDIDQVVLRKAEAGIYELRSVKDTPTEYLDNYFIYDKTKQNFQVNKSVKSVVSFEHLNLNDKERMRLKRNFDIIFCRNVLIYFDDDSRRRAVEIFYAALNEKGYVFLGSSESMGRITLAFKLMRLNKFLVYCKE